MNNAIENLHATFKPYRIGDDFVGCDCCIDPARAKTLLAVPLRDLSYEDLEIYALKAMATWGTARHFKHFLPRILELTVDHRDSFIDLAVVFGKLRSAEWNRWSKLERAAIDRFFGDYWTCQLAISPQSLFDDSIDTVLCALASACDSVQRFLDVWLNTTSDSAKLHFAALVHLNAQCFLNKGTMSNPFWDNRSIAHQQVIVWLQKDELLDNFNCAAEYD